MINKLSSLFAFIILCLGLTAIVFLTSARAEQSIHNGLFFFGLIITIVVLWMDKMWIDRHFIDGEWR